MRKTKVIGKDITVIFMTVMLFSCHSLDTQRTDANYNYYQITEPSVLNQIYVRCEVSLHDSSGVLDNSLISSLQYSPHFIRFSPDSICWLTPFAPGCWEDEERIRHRESYDSSMIYCRDHEFYPWIRTSYSIEKSTNYLIMELELWPLQRAHLDYVYQILKLTSDEIQIKQTRRNVPLRQWAVLHYRALRLNPTNRHTDLPKVSEQYFCCYDSLLVYIQEQRIAEGAKPYQRPVRHDHNNPEINNSDRWYQYFPNLRNE